MSTQIDTNLARLVAAVQATYHECPAEVILAADRLGPHQCDQCRYRHADGED